MKARKGVESSRMFFISLAGLSIISAGFFFVGAHKMHSLMDWYLLWNLFLAWLPVGVSYWLIFILRTKLWSSWSAIALTLAWLLLLPNSFYMVSDFIHLQDSTDIGILYTALMFTLFILNGLILGYASLYMVHIQLRKRLSLIKTESIIGIVLLLCSFAIYLGRDLRWNTWDVLTNPAGILFDVSDRVIHPFANGDTYTTTLMFFIFLTGIYGVVWNLMRFLRSQEV